MGKLLSIIVPSYNMEKYLPKCLGSLIVADADLLQRLDVIVVNDGSKDRTSEIAHEFEKKYSGVFRVIDKPNGHYGSCVNAGLAVAVGAFVKVMDADDSYSTSALVELLNALVKVDDDVDMVLTDHAFVDGEGHVSPRKPVPVPTNQALDSSYLLDAYDDIMIWDTAYRTLVLKELGYRQTEGVAYTDMEWVSLPVARVRKVVHVPVCLYLYQTGREGQSMDPVQLKKNAFMFVTVLKDLVGSYHQQLASLGRNRVEFLERAIFRQTRIIYGLYLYRMPIRVAMDELAKIETHIRQEAKFAYDEISEAFRMGPGGAIPFVKAWRKAGCFKPIVIVAARAYVHLAQLVRG